MCIYFLTRSVKNSRKILRSVILTIFLSILLSQNAFAYSKPRYASVVIDVNSGRTLYARNATSHRYPASLTKIMTLYMLFEQLRQGKVKKWTRLPVSKHATRQEPSKLNLKAGQWITVENAIKALVTKSANDVAVVIAEYIGGTEPRFAVKMTKKARALGMKRTTFKNASGLPNKAQVTTAKDMAILGIKIQANFPDYFKYFKTRSFKYKGRIYGNHNKLLGKYRGVDGIKTGYTRASGFNLVSSVNRNGKSVVAVVIGSKTGNARNKHMEHLLNKAIPKLVTKKAAPKKPKTKYIQLAKVSKPVKKPVLNPAKARLTAHMAQIPKTIIPLNAKNPIKPQQSTTRKIKKDESRINFAAANGNASLPLGFVANISRNNKANLSPIGQKIIAIASARFKTNQTPKKSSAQPIVTAAIFKGQWAVQVGAYLTQQDAKKQLDQLNKIMTPYDAKYYIPSVKKGSKSIYRARFANLSKTFAKKACSAIKRKGYKCLALKNN